MKEQLLRVVRFVWSSGRRTGYGSSGGHVKASPQSCQEMQLDVKTGRSKVRYTVSAGTFPSSQRWSATRLDQRSRDQRQSDNEHRTKGNLNGNGGEAGIFLEAASRGMKATFGERSRASSACRHQIRAR